MSQMQPFQGGFPSTGSGSSSGDEEQASAANHNQLAHFTERKCQGVELPEGVLLRYNQGNEPMYFFLRTTVIQGKICTSIYASDNPYEKEKSAIGELKTAMFEEDADVLHLEKVEKAVRDWIMFVSPSEDNAEPFASFSMDNKD